MINSKIKTIAVFLGWIACAFTSNLSADEFTDADVKRWQEQFMSTVAEGRALDELNTREQRSCLRPMPS